MPNRTAALTENERRLIMYAQQKEAAFLQAQAHARRPAIAHEVLIALNCRELDEGLQAVRQQGGDAEADARPITRGRFSLERETRGGRRCLDQPSIDVAVAVGILMDPRDGRLRHHDAENSSLTIRKRSIGSALVWTSALLPIVLWLLTESAEPRGAAIMTMLISSMQDSSPGWWV